VLVRCTGSPERADALLRLEAKVYPATSQAYGAERCISRLALHFQSSPNSFPRFFFASRQAAVLTFTQSRQGPDR
jgi:hypothetical protein